MTGAPRAAPRRGAACAAGAFLPGTASMIAILGAGIAGGMIWRIAFVIVGLVGLAESLSLRAPGGPVAPPGRTLRALDPLLYLALVAGAFVAPDQFPITPLQIEGLAHGALFAVGLIYVWLAFAERQAEDPVRSA